MCRLLLVYGFSNIRFSECIATPPVMGGFTCAYSCTYIGGMTTNQHLRTQAIDAAIESLDEAFFKALCEASRVAVFKRVLTLGRADVGEIAKELPQERSVVSGICRCCTMPRS